LEGDRPPELKLRQDYGRLQQHRQRRVVASGLRRSRPR